MPASHPACVLVSDQASMNCGSNAGTIENPAKPRISAAHTAATTGVEGAARAEMAELTVRDCRVCAARSSLFRDGYNVPVGSGGNGTDFTELAGFLPPKDHIKLHTSHGRGVHAGLLYQAASRSPRCHPFSAGSD